MGANGGQVLFCGVRFGYTVRFGPRWRVFSQWQENLMFGHHGGVLKVNLGSGRMDREQFGEDFARKFLGGNGLCAKLIYDNVPPDADPLGPDNAIVLTVGPVTDTPIWGSSRGHLAAISPQTGLFADSNFGGKFAVVQKRTGFDAIFISGIADKPVYLLVTEDGAEIKDAAGRKAPRIGWPGRHGRRYGLQEPKGRRCKGRQKDRNRRQARSGELSQGPYRRAEGKRFGVAQPRYADPGEHNQR
jgi:hypothetical protein